MAYFIRRYQKGVAQSGTTDVFVSDSEIPITMFCEMAEMVGPGKYILGQRGEGIRGFKKITDTVVPEPNLRVFAAEDESNKDDKTKIRKMTTRRKRHPNWLKRRRKQPPHHQPLNRPKGKQSLCGGPRNYPT